VVSHHDLKDHWSLMKTPDKKVHLFIPELCEWLEKLPERLAEQNEMEAAFPYNLIAGERRTYNANAVIRHPEWRKTDKAGYLKINSADAAKHQIEEHDTVQLSSSTGSLQILATITDEVPEGIISMPHGHGLNYGEERSYKDLFNPRSTSVYRM